MPIYWVPTYMNQFGQWLQDKNTFIFGRWEGHPEGGYEGGMDVGSAGGTPVYAIGDGCIIAAGYFCHGGSLFNTGPGCASGSPGYGVVTTRVNVPGYGLQDLYYQHIDINPAILPTLYPGKNQCVHRGDLIGTIRPNVGMLEMGFNANWGTIWGEQHPGPWPDDPRPMIAALLSQGPPATLGGQPTLSADGILGSATGLDLTPLIAAVPGIGIKIGIFVLALVLVAFGFYLLFQKQADALVGKGAKLAMKVAA